MGERDRDLEDAAEKPTGEYPISPLLERSVIDAAGHPDLEVGVSVSGSDPIDENELDVFLKQSRIDPGEQIELGLFVSGADEIDEAELSVFHDHGDVIDLENPGTVRRKTSAGLNADVTNASASAEVPVAERVTVSKSSAAGVHAGTAGSNGPADSDGPTDTETVRPTDADDGRPAATGSDRSTETTTPNDDTASTTEYIQPATFRDGADDYALQRKPLGGTGAGGPGYILEINTQATAPPGTYPLPIVFTYRSEDGIKQVRKVRTVHVNTRRERLEPWLTRITVAIVMLITLGLGVLFLVAPSILL